MQIRCFAIHAAAVLALGINIVGAAAQEPASMFPTTCPAKMGSAIPEEMKAVADRGEKLCVDTVGNRIGAHLKFHQAETALMAIIADKEASDGEVQQKRLQYLIAYSDLLDANIPLRRAMTAFALKYFDWLDIRMVQGEHFSDEVQAAYWSWHTAMNEASRYPKLDEGLLQRIAANKSK